MYSNNSSQCGLHLLTESTASSAAVSKYGDGTTLADSFVPGAISNRTLEHLTTVRPHQYRAIRGEQHPAASYASLQYVHL